MDSCVAARKASVTCLLAAETVRLSGRLRLRATGSSMLPAIRPGDILHIKHREMDQMRVGQIGVFLCYGRMVIHRVIEIRLNQPGGPSLSTRGDSLPAPDPAISDVLGIVVGIERHGRIVRPAERLTGIGRIAAAALGRWPHLMKTMEMRLSGAFAWPRTTRLSGASTRTRVSA